MSSARETGDGRILTERRGGVFLIGLDRPEKFNALTPAMFSDLADAFTQLDEDPELRVGVFHAMGKHFTAGLELTRFAEGMRKGESGATGSGGRVDPFALKRKCRKPVVAAVKGIVFTAGIEMMLACDIVIASADCRFSQLEPKRGVMAAGGGTFRFVERCGWGNAMLHLLTADEFTAAEAYRIGLVQEVVEAGRELPRAVEIAEIIAAQAPLAVQATKANAMTYLEKGEVACIGEFSAIQQRLANTEDAREGVQSFIERRAGRFQGR